MTHSTEKKDIKKSCGAVQSHRHSGGISVRIHDDVRTDSCVTEGHVLLRDDEAANTWKTQNPESAKKNQPSWESTEILILLAFNVI